MHDVIITGKKYLKIKFKLASPLMIGCGKSDVTDNDIVRDNRGIPYIPATAIAGVVREGLYRYGIFKYKENKDDREDEDAKKIFGHVRISKKADDEGEQSESRIIFYDGRIIPEDIENINISVRDSVALDEHKTAIDGAKFDMEILEPGVSFCTYVELNCTDGDDGITKAVWKAITAMFQNNALTFGAKTMRGMGEIETCEISVTEFDLTNVQGITDWVDFKMYSEKDGAWDVKWTPKNDPEPLRDGNNIKIDLELELQGGISIRRYTTDVDDPQDEGTNEKADSMPDYEQLTVKGVDGKDIPVIPGTSWGGAFRHRMTELLGEDFVTGLFGEVKEEKKKSLISFSESQITGARDKTISRTAIDRFTGGAAEGALYTEKTYYGGNTQLTIRINDLNRLSEKETVLNALVAAILDLHMGYLAVGGLTSVGRGLFKIKKIHVDGEVVLDTIKDNEAEKVYDLIVKAISGKAGGKNE